MKSTTLMFSVLSISNVPNRSLRFLIFRKREHTYYTRLVLIVIFGKTEKSRRLYDDYNVNSTYYQYIVTADGADCRAWLFNIFFQFFFSLRYFLLHPLPHFSLSVNQSWRQSTAIPVRTPHMGAHGGPGGRDPFGARPPIFSIPSEFQWAHMVFFF